MGEPGTSPTSCTSFPLPPPMAAHAGLSRRAESNNNNIIVIVAIAVGVVVLLAGIVVAFIVVRRRRRNARQTLYQGSAPPMVSYKHSSNMSTSSSLLPDISGSWYQPSPYPQLSHKRLESDTSTRSSLLPEANNGSYRPSHYVPASHKHTTSDVNAKPSGMNNEWGYSTHYVQHSRITSESSTKPLLRDMNNDLDYVERPVPIHRTTEEDILSNNPTGQYRVPVSRPASRGSDYNYTPASSSICLARTDVTPPSDNPYLTPRPLLPPLPPLIIPQKSTDRFKSSQRPSTVAEESMPSQTSAGCASSASSAYSQATAHSPSHSTHLPVPPKGVAPSELERGVTSFVGTLLKARADRNPDGLVRGTSQVSHIERTGSIRSIGGSDQRYPRRYRAKKSNRIEDMDTLREVSDRGSVRSPS